jgi:SAM-dependent methyltransferase
MNRAILFIERILSVLPKPMKRKLKKVYIKSIYSFFTKSHESQVDLTFMNLGYIDQSPPTILKEDIKNQLFINLYHSLFKEVNIKDKNILEVGCGKGGGCYYAYKYLKAKSVVGIDLVKSNIQKCRTLIKYPHINFKIMDAEKFTFTKKFDIIINLESSHCYYSRDLFINRVYKALKPRGYFIYADFMRPQDFIEMKSFFRQNRLKIIKEQNISQNVMKAIFMMEDYKKKVLSNSFITKFLYKGFAVTTDSSIFNDFKTEKIVYMKYILQKT